MRSGSGWRPFPHLYIHERFRTLSPPLVHAVAAPGWLPFGGRRRSTPARTALPAQIRRSQRCGEGPCKKCASNGRFCPRDLRLSILRKHWASQEATNNPFLAHWLRHDRGPLQPTMAFWKQRNQRALKVCDGTSVFTILGHARLLFGGKFGD